MSSEIWQAVVFVSIGFFIIASGVRIVKRKPTSLEVNTFSVLIPIAVALAAWLIFVFIK